MVSDSHIKRIRRNDFNKELHFGTDVHVGTYGISNHANHEDIPSSIINIGLDCKNNGVNDAFLSVKMSLGFKQKLTILNKIL